MDALDRIVREVESDLQEWCNEPLPHEAKVEVEEEQMGHSTMAAQTAGAEIDECGVRYQRCGGGRRIIRKSHGAS